MQPFTYRITKDKNVRIRWYGKPVVILSGKRAEAFIGNIRGLGEQEAQLLLARVTGNFKRGNEKRPTRP